MLTCGAGVAGSAQSCVIPRDAGNTAEFARDKLGLVEAATALPARVQRDGAVGIDRIRVALQIFG